MKNCGNFRERLDSKRIFPGPGEGDARDCAGDECGDTDDQFVQEPHQGEAAVQELHGDDSICAPVVPEGTLRRRALISRALAAPRKTVPAFGRNR